MLPEQGAQSFDDARTVNGVVSTDQRTLHLPNEGKGMEPLKEFNISSPWFVAHFWMAVT